MNKKAILQFDQTDWESTHAAGQDSFETLTLSLRSALKANLHELIPELGEMPFKEVNTILVVIGFGAPREGARAFASCARQGGESPLTEQVGYDELRAAVNVSSAPSTEEHTLLTERVEKLKDLQPVLVAAGEHLIATLLNKSPVLKDCEEAIRQMVFTHLFHGVRVECLLPVLAERKRSEDKLMGRLLGGDDGQTADEKATALRLSKRLHTEGEVSPWPRDMGCLCGASLADALRCCGEGEPITPASLSERLSPDFLLKTDCCGATITGFRCHTCDRFYTWTKGIVDTLENRGDL
jgi:hypothetical protein